MNRKSRKNYRLVSLIAVVAASVGVPACFGEGDAPIAEGQSQTPAAHTPTVCMFKFFYDVTLTNLPPGARARVWLPVATDNHDQDVTISHIELPGSYQKTRDEKFGNQVIYFEAEADRQGEIPIKVDYLVCRREITIANYESATPDIALYLRSSRFVPTGDKLRRALLGNVRPTGSPIDLARILYDGVDTRMKYEKPADKPGWGKGDAVWACDNGFGNCTDFHSLFIASARNLRIPAKFEIGFLIPSEATSGEIGGYHCWAKFLSEGRWIPVDISEADKHPSAKEYYFGNLTADRVQFSTGRDIQLLPPSATPSINYFVYPHVEVNGKPHTSMQKHFRFEQLSQDDAACAKAG